MHLAGDINVQRKRAATGLTRDCARHILRARDADIRHNKIRPLLRQSLADGYAQSLRPSGHNGNTVLEMTHRYVTRTLRAHSARSAYPRFPATNFARTYACSSCQAWPATSGPFSPRSYNVTVCPGRGMKIRIPGLAYFLALFPACDRKRRLKWISASRLAPTECAISMTPGNEAWTG